MSTRTQSLTTQSVRKEQEIRFYSFDPDGDLVLILEYQKASPPEKTLTRHSSVRSAPTFEQDVSSQQSENTLTRHSSIRSAPTFDPIASLPELGLTRQPSIRSGPLSDPNISLPDLGLTRHSSIRSGPSDPNASLPELGLTRHSSVRTAPIRSQSNIASPRTLNSNLMSGETLVAIPSPPATAPLPKPQKQAHMLVSSKHLMLASPVFKAMLNHSCFKEGEMLKSTGKAEVPLHDDDPATFEILMYILHNRPKKVPRQITLETLVKLAILVDKYQMFDIMDLYVDMWMQELGNSIPTSLTDDILSWLTIAWVFRIPVEFANLTRILMWEGEWRVESRLEQGLPIPDRIFQKMEKKRLKTISQILGSIESLTNTFAGKIGVCGVSAEVKLKRHRNCDGMMLGTLLRSASAINLWPQPMEPYDNFTIKEMIGHIREMEFCSLCDVSRNDGKACEAHGFLEWVRDKMDEHEKGLKGLKLGIFLAAAVPPI